MSAVNFFGHAVVASWAEASAAPLVVLGAMLPDFAGMLGGRVDDTAIAPASALVAGVALHHHTDSVFHVLPAVAGLMRELGETLLAAGCRRGPARAAAHLGVELLLDGVLARDQATHAAYLGALEVGDVPIGALGPNLDDALATLRRRLAIHGVPTDLDDAEVATRRVVRAIAGRPRLAADARDVELIGHALGAMQPRVVAAAPTIVRGVRAGLATR